MTRQCVSVLLVFLILVATRAGHAEGEIGDGDDKPHPKSFVVGVGLGNHAGKLSIEGGDSRALGASTAVGAELGYSHPLGQSAVALFGLFRYGTWDDNWSTRTGEGRHRFDLLFGPELRAWADDAETVEAGIGFGAGPSFAVIDPLAHRTFHDEYGLGAGFNAGLSLALRFLPRAHVGAFFALDVGYYSIWIERHAWVTNVPELDSRERHRYFGWETYLRLGCVLAL